MPAQTSSNPADRISTWNLWFGFTGGAAAWALHGFISLMLSAQACEDGSGRWGPLSPGAVRLLMAGVTVGLLAVAVFAGLTSFRNWQRLAHDREVLHAEASGREQFMALAGIFVGAIFVIGICWGGLPLILLDICNKGR